LKATPSRVLIAVFIAMSLAMLMVSCAPTPKSNIVSSGEIRVYEVFGMDCPGCHGGLEKLVKAVDGVVAAQASWQEKRLTVTVAEGAELSDDAIREAIARANFSSGERLK